MKKLLIFACVFSVAFAVAQEVKPTYEAFGNKVKATYYYEDGSIQKQGYFKNQKLEGKWVEFDRKGKKVTVGYYKSGKKVGTWFMWTDQVLRQVSYKNNTVASVNVLKEDDTRLVVNEE